MATPFDTPPTSTLPPLAPLPARAPARPDARFMLRHPAHLLALGLGSGLSPVAPGTAGTLWAWLAFVAMRPHLGEAAMTGVIALALGLGWWACTVTARHMGVQDPGSIVWDEVVAFWLVLWLVTPAGFHEQLAAFVLFRLFDAAKPGPVGWADQAFKGEGARGGFGILFDDLVAAACTLLVFALWRFFA